MKTTDDRAKGSFGTLYGIGVGPGDPDLITLKALKIIQKVPVLAWPALLEGDSLARSIAAPHLDGHHEEIAIRMPMEVARFPAQSVYDQAAIDIGERLKSGQDVAVLCEGDPFFYGSFMYLFGRMSEKFDVEVVPGVSSIMAAAASIGAPLASRNDIMTVLPAPLDEEILAGRLVNIQSAVLIKVGRHLAKVKRVLEKSGLLDQAQFISHATMDNQTVRPLKDVDEDKAPYFSIIMVHKRGKAWEE